MSLDTLDSRAIAPVLAALLALPLAVASPRAVAQEARPAAGGVAAATAVPAEPRPMAPMDVFQLEYATDPRISPDGDRVVYERRFMDVMKDRVRSNLWIVRADGSGHRPLTTGAANHSSPRWSPDGTRIAYVAEDENGDRQIFVRWLDTGQTARLTSLSESPGGLAWSPDGSRLAFTMFVAEEREPWARMPDKPEGAEWAPAARVFESVVYRADGGGYLEPGHDQLFVVSAEGGTPVQLTSGPYDHGGEPAWTPDGEHLILSANRRPDWRHEPSDTEIHEVSVADGSIRALTDRRGPDGQPAVSPDGSMIAYTGFDDRHQGYQVTRLYVMGRDGSESRPVAPDFDRDVGDPRWASDGRGLFFQYDDEGNTKVAHVSLDGRVTDLASDLGGTSLGRPYAGGSFTVASDGRFAYTHSRPGHPADVALGRRGGGADGATRLTRLNEDLLGRVALGEVEEIWWESSHDGRRIQGWIVRPPGFDPSRRYPLLLEIHGGPFANYGDRFSAEIQLYAADGYVVLYANPRGSTSYGEEFGNLIHHAYPGNDFDDLMSGVDAVIERGYVDPDRLFVTGGSGGGVLSAWIVGHTDRFRAAAVQKPVINWYSWALTADMYVRGIDYWFPGPPWEHAEHYMERSPLSYVGNVTTPTLLITGEADYRTPMSESEQFYQALQYRKVPSALVRIPEASHGIAARPSNLVAKVVHVLGWFERHADRAATAAGGR